MSALKEVADTVEVLAPRPIAPLLLSSLNERWKAYSSIRGYELRDGVHVHRPRYLQVPRIGAGWWLDKGAFLHCIRLVKRRHAQVGFDAILAFDLAGAGGLAWRLGEHLGVPVAGWATGGDVRATKGSGVGRVVARALTKLDLVFYQSRELRATAASLVGERVEDWSAERHVILPRGILPPPALHRAEVRRRVRAELGLRQDEQLLLSIGRLKRAKGIGELVRSFALAAAKRPNLRCVIVGAHPGFDDRDAVEESLNSLGECRKRLVILPACSPDQVWEFLCAADVFGFASHEEGMPNSLLEAMAMAVPAVAFAIPAVIELEGGSGGVLTVAPFNVNLFAEAVLDLCDSAEACARIGRRGQETVLSRFDSRRNMAAALGHMRRLTGCAGGAGHGAPGRGLRA